MSSCLKKTNAERWGKREVGGEEEEKEETALKYVNSKLWLFPYCLEE